MPAYQTSGAAGFDLHACLESGEPIPLEPGNIVVVPTGLAMAIPEGFEGQVRPRSGLASKFGVTLPNAPGTIDWDYRGEIKVPLVNLGRQVVAIEPGMRIAQMVISPVVRVRIVASRSLDATARGSGGFGSTGR